MTEMSESVKKMTEATGSIKQSERQLRTALRHVLTVIVFTLVLAAIVEFLRSGVPLSIATYLEGILVAKNIIYPTFVILILSVFILNALRRPVYYISDRSRKFILTSTDFMAGVALFIFAIKSPIWGDRTDLYGYLSTLSSLEAAATVMNVVLMFLFALRYIVRVICFLGKDDGGNS